MARYRSIQGHSGTPGKCEVQAGYRRNTLAFARYCHCQYCVVYITITGVGGERNSVGDDGGVCLNKGRVRKE